MKSLDAVTASLEKLAKYTPQPHVVNGSAALHSGVKEILAGTALEELLDELAYSAKERYVPMGKERKEVREACKRRDKALGTYTSLRDQCNKLEKKKDVGEKEKEQYTTQCLARDAQAVEYRRYDTECSERYKEFLQSAGGVVLEDSRELTAVLHNFYSSLSYQFRKYEELLGESPCSRTEGLSQSNVSA
ncbi:hypothetical protein AGDE_03068 [Angomonas deanei]|uniref:BAR domain containing protein n=1 Tax=Angomonas deanei TaxID=59799 RepID=S9VIZ6_9TRYP|nr:hypothetical protein AGDE_04701 [Angomonas deanei]EPY40858.1 hypothetical protein AGDE_03068 [Angomonas deanei]CAD2221087.1 hypothetical protein, conserved [Angomonas deanei]|eukprot:EPY39227.1 hypothetical protein AGDE_04701 [Angomonas deanei]